MGINELQKCLNDPDYLVKKYFINREYCMAYDRGACCGNIVRAHTISKRYIKNVAEDGHVYIPVSSSHNQNNLYEFRLKGIHDATHILGFCKYHDNHLFSSFEKAEFSGSYEQIYDITFRALCREYFLKKCMFKYLNLIRNGDLNILDQTGYTKSEHFIDIFKKTVKETRGYKFLYNQIKSVKKSGLSYIVIRLSRLPILATGVIFPLINPKGYKIQNESKKQLGFIYNVITLTDKSYVIISTVKSLHNNIHKEYLKSLASMKNDRLINYFLTNIFFNTDNTVVDPRWFNQLDKKFKSDIMELQNLQVGHYGKKSAIDGLINFEMIIDFDNISIDIRIE